MYFKYVSMIIYTWYCITPLTINRFCRRSSFFRQFILCMPPTSRLRFEKIVGLKGSALIWNSSWIVPKTKRCIGHRDVAKSRW